MMHYIQQVLNAKECSCQPRILVVDDNQFNIMVVKSIINEDFDIDVDEASNGAIGLKMF